MLEVFVYWIGGVVCVTGIFILTAAFLYHIVYQSLNFYWKRTMEALEITHGIVKVRMALANSKYIKWDMSEGDDE